LVPNGTADVVVSCGGKHIPLADWEHTYGQDIGAAVAVLPPSIGLLDEARTVLVFI
jgi:hypothetical protein